MSEGQGKEKGKKGGGEKRPRSSTRYTLFFLQMERQSAKKKGGKLERMVGKGGKKGERAHKPAVPLACKYRPRRTYQAEGKSSKKKGPSRGRKKKGGKGKKKRIRRVV